MTQKALSVCECKRTSLTECRSYPHRPRNSRHRILRRSHRRSPARKRATHITVASSSLTGWMIS